MPDMEVYSYERDEYYDPEEQYNAAIEPIYG